tara:strand:- start:207 stop:380 length:174 start_codon:yes stop_codon:yes gene_type:complete
MMTKDQFFKENVYGLAFGDDAINKGYTDKEVLEKLFQNLQSLQQYVDHFGEMFGEER